MLTPCASVGFNLWYDFYMKFVFAEKELLVWDKAISINDIL
jgi:hypothetical protein